MSSLEADRTSVPLEFSVCQCSLLTWGSLFAFGAFQHEFQWKTREVK